MARSTKPKNSEVAGDEEDSQGPKGTLTLLNELGTHAFKKANSGKYYELWQRTFYMERTEVPVHRTGEIKVYEEGTYGPWQRSSTCPFPTRLEWAIRHVAEELTADEINKMEVANLQAFLDVFELKVKEIEKVAKKLE